MSQPSQPIVANFRNFRTKKFRQKRFLYFLAELDYSKKILFLNHFPPSNRPIGTFPSAHPPCSFSSKPWERWIIKAAWPLRTNCSELIDIVGRYLEKTSKTQKSQYSTILQNAQPEPERENGIVVTAHTQGMLCSEKKFLVDHLARLDGGNIWSQMGSTQIGRLQRLDICRRESMLN